jgi:hypothetical protein
MATQNMVPLAGSSQFCFTISVLVTSSSLLFLRESVQLPAFLCRSRSGIVSASGEDKLKGGFKRAAFLMQKVLL